MGGKAERWSPFFLFCANTRGHYEKHCKFSIENLQLKIFIAPI